MSQPSRDDLLLRYLDLLPFDPYPVQEEALMRYFESDEGVMVTAPTGMGKTLIAEAALFEALATGRQAYYTTPLIALTEQKFREVQHAAERWGFSRDRVGLVTGNRSVNPRATVLVVVAEILLNRLLHTEAFDFSQVGAVVMDEFHSFAEPERGVVWELSLSLLPKHVRLMLLSATVGNAGRFLNWLEVDHGRKLALVQGNERRVPLSYHWIGDQLLPDLLVNMASGDEAARKTPALVFCFDRERCWSVAELLRGKDMLAAGQQKLLAERLEALDASGELSEGRSFFSGGAGPKLRRVLLRGVGIHHAGLLPRHRRLVESLFQDKLLSVCVCTETLAAGMNLPARSVVLTTLVKGPRGRKKLIAPSSAHQMFGRAGRPQFDTQGHVYAVAHEDDVKILRHQEKIAQIPEDTKDPQLMKARKRLIKQTPSRRDGEQYWNEAQFEKLQQASPGDLVSTGDLPWRLLAFMLDASSDVRQLRQAVSKRLMTDQEITRGQQRLTQMLTTLHDLGYVTLTPPPPPEGGQAEAARAAAGRADEAKAGEAEAAGGLLAGLTLGGLPTAKAQAKSAGSVKEESEAARGEARGLGGYEPREATATPALRTLLAFRAVHPLYGAFLLDYLGEAERHERVQLFESLLEMPDSVARLVRVPWPEDLPPGPMTLEMVDPAVLRSGLLTQEEMYPPPVHEQDRAFGELPKFPVPLAEKVRLLFENSVAHAGRVRITPVWAAGDLLTFSGDFHGYIAARDLAKQEGIIFRHVLRLILLCDEFAQVTPRGLVASAWQAEMKELASHLTEACRSVDPASTDEVLSRGD
jgi:superfamily II DNA/RNA helicase